MRRLHIAEKEVISKKIVLGVAVRMTRTRAKNSTSQRHRAHNSIREKLAVSACRNKLTWDVYGRREVLLR